MRLKVLATALALLSAGALGLAPLPKAHAYDCVIRAIQQMSLCRKEKTGRGSYSYRYQCPNCGRNWMSFQRRDMLHCVRCPGKSKPRYHTKGASYYCHHNSRNKYSCKAWRAYWHARRGRVTW